MRNIYRIIVVLTSLSLLYGNPLFSQKQFKHDTLLTQLADQYLNTPIKKTTSGSGEVFLQRDMSEYLHGVSSKIGKRDKPHVDDPHQIYSNMLEAYLSRPHPSVTTLNNYFDRAAQEFSVPAIILKSVAQVQTNWTHIGGSVYGAWGITGLVENQFIQQITLAATIIALPANQIKDDPFSNIRAAAALLRHYKKNNTESGDVTNWFDAVRELTGLQMEEMKTQLAVRYFNLISSGSKTVTLWREIIEIKPSKINSIDKIASSYNLKNGPVAKPQVTTDYTNAVAGFIPNCNYGTRNNTAINFFIIHYTTGTYQSAINWFNTCTRLDANGNVLGPTSAHYIIRNSDGLITQLVPEADNAYATGTNLYNQEGISVEHEVLATDLAMWDSEPMLCAAGQLCNDVCERNNIPKKRKTINGDKGIYGHDEVKIDANGKPLTACPNLTPARWDQFMDKVRIAAGGPNFVFNVCNTPEFTTNIFNAIGVGKGGHVWAGTPNQGVYKYSSGSWKKCSALTNNNIQDIKTDRDGGIWVAQSGSNGGQALTGGINYFPDSSFNLMSYYGATLGVPSRNARSLFVDTSRYNGSTALPLVWSAHLSHITGGTSSSGGLGRGLNEIAPFFNANRNGLETTNGLGACQAIGGNANEIWTFAANNFSKSQILRYDATTNAFIGAYDTTNVLNGIVSGQFLARAIYFDSKGKNWIGITSAGLLVKEGPVFQKVSLPAVFGTNPFFNNNAITGDTSGNVYFGTSNGLVMYQTGKPVNDASSYQVYTTADGLPSNNIKSICVDTTTKKLLIATDNGIAFWRPICSTIETIGENTFITTSTGTFDSAAIWCTSIIPNKSNDVIIRHPITITVNTEVRSMKVIPPGSVTISPGAQLNILH